MTDPLRPNPLGLPLEPDPTLPSEDPTELPGADDTGRAIDDPVAWPVDTPESPDDRSLDLPGETSDALGREAPEPQLA